MQFPYTRSGLVRWYSSDLLADVIREIGKSYDHLEAQDNLRTALLAEIGLGFGSTFIYAKDYKRFLAAVPRLEPK